MLGIVQRAMRTRVPLSVVLGCVLAVAVMGPQLGSMAPTTSAASSQTRVFSCPGLDFVPWVSKTEFFANGLTRSSYDTDFYFCNAALPNKAVVTKVQFTLFDASAYHEFRYCTLTRVGLKPAQAATYWNLAEVPPTGVAAAPGYVRLTDSTISTPTIDNSNFAYWLQCQFNMDPTAVRDRLGLVGADIVYTISAANG